MCWFFYSCWDETYYHLSDSTSKLLILRLNYKFTIKIFWVACTHLLLIICDLCSYISWYGFVCIHAIYFDDEFWSLPRVVGSDHRLYFFFKSQCSIFISLLHSLVHEQRLIGFELWQILLLRRTFLFIPYCLRLVVGLKSLNSIPIRCCKETGNVASILDVKAKRKSGNIKRKM